jgi:Family of unknown function (DUF6516)
MPKRDTEHTLEFLLDFDGRVHWDAGGYWVKFEIRRVDATAERPHGLSYSFTLHGPDNERLIGFDNAHAVAPPGARYKKKAPATDHWHRTENDPGRPYTFKDAATLIDDVFDEVERVLTERGIPFQAVEAKEGE